MTHLHSWGLDLQPLKTKPAVPWPTASVDCRRSLAREVKEVEQGLPPSVAVGR